MKDWTHPKNDGWTAIEYDFGFGAASNRQLSYIFNEACHVFHCHADGHWKSHDKDAYAKLLIIEFTRFPALAPRVLTCGDRVIKMVAYRALEMMNETAD